jgi:hypothetical protein
MFHAALLKKFEGTQPDRVVALPPILLGLTLPVPEKVVKARLNRANRFLVLATSTDTIYVIKKYGCHEPTPKTPFLMSTAYVSRHQKSIFNNTKRHLSPDLGPQGPDLSPLS